MYSTLSTDDTIAAIASATGGAVRGIVRVSGADSLDILARGFREHAPLINRLQRPRSLDAGLPTAIGMVPGHLYLWPTSRSYTRQPSAEFHTVGSLPVLESVLATLYSCGARPAEPGEFTLRAFLAGRLDLLQAEAVLGVINATGPAELSSALAQLAGGLSEPIYRLRATLLDSLVQLEAELDFADEDIEFIARDRLTGQIASAMDLVSSILSQMSHRNVAKEEPRVSLLGYPNVGKSSLFNALARRSASIVSPTEGATRDFVTCQIEGEGVAYTLVDTAGVGHAAAAQDDRSLFAAVTISRQQHAASQLRVLCLDSSRDLNSWESSELEAARPANTIIAWTKSDVAAACVISNAVPIGVRAVRTSSQTGLGVAELSQVIREVLGSQSRTSDAAMLSSRCRENLVLCRQALQGAKTALFENLGDELVAADLRTALNELAGIVGATYTDDILERIFGQFCIGK